MANLTIPQNHRVHKTLRDLMLRPYWESEQEVTTAIIEALALHGIRADPPWMFADGYKVPCDACAPGGRFDNQLNIRFNDGECHAYIS